MTGREQQVCACLPAVTSSLSQGSIASALSLSLCAGQLSKHTAPSFHPSSHHMPPDTLHGLLLLLLVAVCQMPYDDGPLLLLLLPLMLAAGLCEKSGSRCEGSSLGLLRSQNHSLPAEGPRSPAHMHDMTPTNCSIAVNTLAYGLLACRQCCPGIANEAGQSHSKNKPCKPAAHGTYLRLSWWESPEGS